MSQASKEDRLVSQPFESGRRLLAFRLLGALSFLLLIALLGGLVVRPWRNAEAEATRQTAENAYCRQGVAMLGSTIGKETENPQDLQTDLETLVSTSGLCRSNLETAKQEKIQSSNSLAGIERIYGSIDLREPPKDAPLCKSRLAVANRCAEAIGFETRTANGSWFRHTVQSGYVLTVNVVQWCDMNDVFVRPADNTLAGRAVVKMTLSSGVPITDTMEESEASPNMALYCNASAVALFEL